jgi:hypothetical protein
MLKGPTKDYKLDDELDIARDEFISDLYSDFARDVLSGHDDLYQEVVQQFTIERLQSYYLDHPKLAEPAVWALQQARLIVAHPSAALVFGTIATEVGLKAAILKPILFGLVHTDSVAAFIAELIPEQRNDKFRKALFAILRELGGVDLESFRRSGCSKTLWQEIAETHERRNAILHRAEQVTASDAELALEIARTVVEDLFPTVIYNLGLHLHGKYEVCGNKRH